MAYEEHEYGELNWQNNAEPALSAENLNHMDKGISYNSKNIKELKALQDSANDKIETLESTSSVLKNTSAGSMNGRYEDKNLGSGLSSYMTKVKNGDFSDLSVGNYFTINNVKWRVAGADILLNTGDTQLTKHHLVLIPDSNILSADGSSTKYMNDTETTAGGYQGSKMWKTTLPSLLSSLPSAITNCLISHRELMSNAYSGGASGWAWADVKVNIPTEAQVYGTGVFGLSNLGGGNGYNTGNCYEQFPLFQLVPAHICNRAAWWLRDCVSASYFADVGYDGNAGYNGASYAWVGVRPYVLVGA